METTKTCRHVVLALVMAGLAFCALACGCTTVENTTTDQSSGVTEISQAPQGDMQRTPPENGTRGGPDLASAAATLGVTEDALRDALGDGTGNGGMDLEGAASELGVTVEDLQNALGGPSGGQMPPDGQIPMNGTPPQAPSAA
jgi:hypothetical protein